MDAVDAADMRHGAGEIAALDLVSAAVEEASQEAVEAAHDLRPLLSSQSPILISSSPQSRDFRPMKI